MEHQETLAEDRLVADNAGELRETERVRIESEMLKAKRSGER
jgi:hypothetical protein